MKKLILTILAVCASCAAYADEKAAASFWRDELVRDIVTVNGSVMTMEEGGILSINTVQPTELRVKIVCDAPAKGVISRDNFVVVVTAMYNSIFMNLTTSLLPELPASRLEASYNFRSEPKAKQNADVIISISLNAKGISLQVRNSRNQNVQTFPMTWAQYFGIAEADPAQGAKNGEPSEGKGEAGAAKEPSKK